MSGYDVIVFFHVLAVIVWVGGGVMLQVLLYRAAKAGPEAVGQLTQSAEWTSQRVFMPASIAALGFGIWAVAMRWRFNQTWIELGLAGFAITLILGSAVLGPTSAKMKKVIEERGPQDPALQPLRRRIDVVGKLNLLILVAVVLDMVAKPGT